MPCILFLFLWFAINRRGMRKKWGDLVWLCEGSQYSEAGNWYDLYLLSVAFATGFTCWCRWFMSDFFFGWMNWIRCNTIAPFPIIEILGLCLRWVKCLKFRRSPKTLIWGVQSNQMRSVVIRWTCYKTVPCGLLFWAKYENELINGWVCEASLFLHFSPFLGIRLWTNPSWFVSLRLLKYHPCLMVTWGKKHNATQTILKVYRDST